MRKLGVTLALIAASFALVASAAEAAKTSAKEEQEVQPHVPEGRSSGGRTTGLWMEPARLLADRTRGSRRLPNLSARRGLCVQHHQAFGAPAASTESRSRTAASVSRRRTSRPSKYIEATRPTPIRKPPWTTRRR